eukprot:823185-Heterocapsa_arctica.AAC.1
MCDFYEDGVLVAVRAVESDQCRKVLQALLDQQDGHPGRPSSLLLDAACVDDPLAVLRRACRS